MQRKSLLALSSLLVLGLLIAVLASSGASAAAGCNKHSLQGNYGWAMSGSIFNAGTEVGDLASAGHFIFDGQGGLVGAETDSFNGQVSSAIDTGTYTLNADCTGTLAFQEGNGSPNHNNIVVVDETRQIKFITTDPGAALEGTLVKQ